MSTFSSSNAHQPPQEDNHQPSSISSLPEEIVLSCLARAPRNCYLNLSHVSKTLRSLVRSPELHRLRSLLHKNSLYVCFKQYSDSSYRWLTLRLTEKATTVEYRLVPVQFPSHPCMYASSAVTVGSEFYFVSRYIEPSSDVWILDTRSGKFTQGPSMKFPSYFGVVMGVIDGNIYVIDENSQIEVLDQETKIWSVEKVPLIPWYDMQYAASLERKVLIVESDRTRVYNPRKQVVDETRVSPSEDVEGVCVVENVPYACFDQSGLMWFDTKLNVWNKLVIRDGEELLCYRFREFTAMAEYEGKLALFESRYFNLFDKTIRVTMFLLALDRVGESIFGTIEWSGVVATIPSRSRVVHCLVAAD